MINIVKEIKIELLKGVKFLMRVYKRDAVFSFALAMFIVCFFFTEIVKNIPCVDTIIFCSAVISLTCIFLYIIDFINAIKRFITKPKVIEYATRVKVGIPKK